MASETASAAPLIPFPTLLIIFFVPFTGSSKNLGSIILMTWIPTPIPAPTTAPAVVPTTGTTLPIVAPIVAPSE